MDNGSSVREAQRLGMTIEDAEWFVRECPEFRVGTPTKVWCYIANRLAPSQPGAGSEGGATC